ncbi:MAG: hypothetical protein ACR2RF_05390 [Geminicoccaceae bacterium]
MTPTQRSKWAEFCQLAGEAMVPAQSLCADNPSLEATLSGVDKDLYIRSVTLSEIAADLARKARLDWWALKERIEANAD